MQIENLDISKIKPYINNPRNNDGAVEYVAKSIKEFGFRVPIIIDKKGVIVAGHTRYKAAKQLGLKTVPCIRADDLTDEQVKAFRIADNKVSEYSSWDMGKLEIELDGISLDMGDFGIDIDALDEINDFNDDEGYYGDERNARIRRITLI